MSGSSDRESAACALEELDLTRLVFESGAPGCHVCVLHQRLWHLMNLAAIAEALAPMVVRIPLRVLHRHEFGRSLTGTDRLVWSVLREEAQTLIDATPLARDLADVDHYIFDQAPHTPETTRDADTRPSKHAAIGSAPAEPVTRQQRPDDAGDLFVETMAAFAAKVGMPCSTLADAITVYDHLAACSD